MPSLGADMEEGKLVQWKVQPGDAVKRGDIIAIVHTEKAEIEVEVFESGLVDRLLVQPGALVPVGTVLAILRTDQKGATAVTPAVAPPPKPAGEARPRISPLARKMAAELGVDLSAVQGTGAHGAIEKSDIEHAASLQRAKPAPPPTQPLAVAPSPATPTEAYQGMRRAIAAAMARSNREIPHYYLETQIDMSVPLRWLEAANQQRPVQQRLLPVVLLLKAVAHALGEVPELNGYWKDDRNEPQKDVHIGFLCLPPVRGLIITLLNCFF